MSDEVEPIDTDSRFPNGVWSTTGYLTAEQWALDRAFLGGVRSSYVQGPSGHYWTWQPVVTTSLAIRDTPSDRKPGIPRAVLVWAFVSLLVILSILAAALLIGPGSTATSEGLVMPSGSGSSASSLVPGAPWPSSVEDNGAPLSGGSDGEASDRAGQDDADPEVRDLSASPAARQGGLVSRPAHQREGGLLDQGRPGYIAALESAALSVPETHIGEPLSSLPDTATEIAGTATYCAPTPRYCHRWGGRALLGAVQSFRWGDKPYSVRVCLQGTQRCTAVTVVSFCDCGKTLIDLSPYAFRQLAPLWRGRIRVTVERSGGTVLPLPPTDTR